MGLARGVRACCSVLCSVFQCFSGGAVCRGVLHCVTLSCSVVC